MYDELVNLTFSDPTKLVKSLTSKRILMVIPAISIGKPGVNNQYRDYLDQSALVYSFLKVQNYSVNIFALGAIHRGEGFLHQLGKNYLIQTHSIPSNVFVWDDNKFKNIGLCSVEEAQLLNQFLETSKGDSQILTIISKSQLPRYYLHQYGYGINSVYYVFSDNPDYYHLQNADQEKILISITEKDPRWESETGKELRRLAHRLRDPNEPDITPEEIQDMQYKILGRKAT